MVLLITPPFTQLNTPYPATAYLKGFLETKGISSMQCDLGIEVIIKIFSSNGLLDLFQHIHQHPMEMSENSKRIVAMQQRYIETIDAIILFLQGKNNSLAHRICQPNFLPQASRFQYKKEVQDLFGTMGIFDKAKHYATLYVEDIADLITETVDTHFGFSRYAERLARSASSFDELFASLQEPLRYIDRIALSILEEKFTHHNFSLVGFSVPFPGNVYSAFRCAQFIKQKFATCKTMLGGGFVNTELRSLQDDRVMQFFDFITLDDGETPLELIIHHVERKSSDLVLKRCFVSTPEGLQYVNNSLQRDYKQQEVGTPNYTDLALENYLSVIEVSNPMHRLWSDGRWNKLTMAHGCYWGKCTFCDISLPYIKDYEPLTAKLLCDRMEELIKSTGENGFHFVDEAAPPALMKALAIEIVHRKLIVSWWTNIRFEKSFTRDLCLLLKASGCIGVSGGLEVASDRLLALIQKGITIKQVAQVTHNLTQAGILVHAYLMYGFPTQTAQETIDSLEIVRQLFACNLLHSGFWHQFALTAHSPVGLSPEQFGVKIKENQVGTFANNDLLFDEIQAKRHDLFSEGLKKSLFNYMHGTCFDQPLATWFAHKVPSTTITKEAIQSLIQNEEHVKLREDDVVVWIGVLQEVEFFTKSKKGNQWEICTITFCGVEKNQAIQLAKKHGEWLLSILPNIAITANKKITIGNLKKMYEEFGLEDFELFWCNKPMNTLHKFGLYLV